MVTGAVCGGCVLLGIILLYVFWPSDFEVAIQRQQINATHISFAPNDCSVRTCECNGNRQPTQRYTAVAVAVVAGAAAVAG